MIKIQFGECIQSGKYPSHLREGLSRRGTPTAYTQKNASPPERSGAFFFPSPGLVIFLVCLVHFTVLLLDGELERFGFCAALRVACLHKPFIRFALGKRFCLVSGCRKPCFAVAAATPVGFDGHIVGCGAAGGIPFQGYARFVGRALVCRRRKRRFGRRTGTGACGGRGRRGARCCFGGRRTFNPR